MRYGMVQIQMRYQHDHCMPAVRENINTILRHNNNTIRSFFARAVGKLKELEKLLLTLPEVAGHYTVPSRFLSNWNKHTQLETTHKSYTGTKTLHNNATGTGCI